MPQLTRLTAALVVALVAATTAHAQVRQVRPAAPIAAPSANARATQAAPNPAGLRATFPAGLTSGSGALVASDPVAAQNAPLTLGATGTGATGTTLGTTTVTNGRGTVTGGTLLPADSAFTANGPALPSDVNTGLPQFNAGSATTVMGAAGGGGLARGPAQTVAGGGGGAANGFSAVDIARSFINADGNRDGELSRSEARRLTLAMQSFEEMDRNYDGVITRGEYEDGLR
jgi:hypothetical protein